MKENGTAGRGGRSPHFGKCRSEESDQRHMGRVGHVKRAAVRPDKDPGPADQTVEKADRRPDQGKGPFFRAEGNPIQDRVHQGSLPSGTDDQDRPFRPVDPEFRKPGKPVGRPAREPVSSPRREEEQPG